MNHHSRRVGLQPVRPIPCDCIIVVIFWDGQPLRADPRVCAVDVERIFLTDPDEVPPIRAPARRLHGNRQLHQATRSDLVQHETILGIGSLSSFRRGVLAVLGRRRFGFGRLLWMKPSEAHGARVGRPLAIVNPARVRRVLIEETNNRGRFAAVDMVERKFRVGGVGRGVRRLTHNRHILSVGRNPHPPLVAAARKQHRSDQHA
jgi:hypothetical protein